MNIIEDMTKCYGCGSCFNICPQNAIEMRENEEGFLFPKVDFYKCIDCGMCRKSCPRLNPAYFNSEHPDSYALMADDKIREKSSSGGAFTILAKYVFAKGGVVCGSALNENFEASHIIIDDEKDIDLLRKSKYIQSSIGSVYSCIKEYLNNGRWVLFTGTPCQVAGLYAFLGKKYDNLLTADVICHGTPSPKVWRKYLSNISDGKKISHVDFRYKGENNNLDNSNLKIEFADGTKKILLHKDFQFIKEFEQRKISRNSCSECQFARFPRQGDFTIGDFWGAKIYNPELYDSKGFSLVLLNNENSVNLWNTIREEFGDIINNSIPVTAEVISKKNPQLYHYPEATPKRKNFIKNYLETGDFEKAENMTSNSTYDIGIVSWFFATNYGAVLTSFALTRFLDDIGYTSTLIDIPNQFWSDSKHLRNPMLFSKRFIYKYCNVTAQFDIKNENDMKKLNRRCRSFAVASDQLWRWDKIKNCYEFFFLNFANENKKKFSYSTSFGGRTFSCDDPDKMQNVKNMLHSFAGVSVREKNGVNICKKTFDIDAVQVLDPVFLCDRKHYDCLAAHSKVKGKRFVVAYMLAYSEEKDRVLREYAKMLDCEIILIPDATKGQKAEWSMKMTTDIEIEDFIYYIKNSKLVITDSFHAVCFSIIYGVNFIATSEGRAGKDRFTSILELTGIKGRLLPEFKEILSKPELITDDIDFSKAHKLLNREKIKSLNWIINTMEK